MIKWKNYIKKYKKLDIKPEIFNMRSTVLTRQYILDLKETINNENIPNAHGFFWENEEYDKKTVYKDLVFCKQTLKFIDNRIDVIYLYWW